MQYRLLGFMILLNVFQPDAIPSEHDGADSSRIIYHQLDCIVVIICNNCHYR